MGEPKSIHFPQEWETLVRGRGGACYNSCGASAPSPPEEAATQGHANGGAAGSRKRRREAGPPTSTSDSAVDDDASVDSDMGVKSTQDVCRSILQVLNRTTRVGSDVQETYELDLDHVLSRVPYKEILRDLFGSVGGTQAPVHVPVVSRVYEEQFMREPHHSTERQCVMGAECECTMIDKSNPFVGVEFLLPDEVRQDDVQMCVLCHRRFVQLMYHDMVYSGKQFRGVIQRYGNICGQSGEYAKEVALICPPNGPTQCMPLPSISHQRNKYSVTTVGGVRHIVQHAMSPEDFGHPPRGAH